MKLKKIKLCWILLFLLTTPCLADEVYVEKVDADGTVFSGYVDIDNENYVEGFIENLEKGSFFIEDNIDTFDFYEMPPEGKRFFDDTEGFFDQEYEEE